MSLLSRFLYFWLIINSLLIFAACSVKSKVQKDKESFVESSSNLLIYIQQSPCLGKCSVYEASFYSGQQLVYNGLSRMPLMGKFRYLLPSDMTKNLIFEAVKMNLAQLPDSTEIPAGAQKVILKIAINGKMKKIVASPGNSDPAFRDYVRLLHTEVCAMVTEQEGVVVP
jgi:Domain of unknown function (DUF6438)